MCHAHSPLRIALWALFPAIAPLERLQPVGTLRQAQDEGCCAFSLGAANTRIYSANNSPTRLFCLPFFSILPSLNRPISPVRRTCVPPQGCRSTSPMRISRTRP